MRIAVLNAARRSPVALALLTALFIAVTVAPPAAAHTQLAGSSPAPGVTVQRLDDIRLQFYGPLRPEGPNAVRLLDPGGARWDTSPARAVTDRELVVGVRPGLTRTGQYTVRWCATSVDGHAQSGAYLFSYDGPTHNGTARPATPAPDPAPACASAPQGGVATLTGWLLGAIVAGSVLFLVLMTLLNRRRSGDQRDGPLRPPTDHDPDAGHRRPGTTP